LGSIELSSDCVAAKIDWTCAAADEPPADEVVVTAALVVVAARVVGGELDEVLEQADSNTPALTIAAATTPRARLKAGCFNGLSIPQCGR
jgi:hypothetical protein